MNPRITLWVVTIIAALVIIYAIVLSRKTAEIPPIYPDKVDTIPVYPCNDGKCS